MADTTALDLTAIAAAIATRALSPVDLMRGTLDRIAAVNGAVNAIVALQDRERLMGAARIAEAMAPLGPLHGMPVAVKDTVAVKGIRSTWGAPFLADYVPEVDDPLARRLRDAGAIIIGKTNVPLYALGSHTRNAVYGVTRNPRDLSRSAGGSSGGAAAALATGMVAVADGSDMMGSLRNPAAWNDVYGFRPTIGMVPAEARGAWMVPQISTQGPMARSVADLEVMLGVMSDGAYAPLSAPTRPARVGWLGDWGGAFAMEAGVMDQAEGALATMRDLGWSVEALAPPVPSGTLWQSWCDLRAFCIAMEMGPVWRDPDRRAQLNPQATWEVLRGLSLSAQQIEDAAQTRRAWCAILDDLFARFDLLVLPATQVWPFPVEWDWPRDIGGREMDSYHRWMEVVVPASLAGVPAINLPAGIGPRGLPAGVQALGRAGNDARVLGWARAYAEAIGPRRIVDP